MKNTQGGFIGVLLFIIIALGAVGMSGYVYLQEKKKTTSKTFVSATSTSVKTEKDKDNDMTESAEKAKDFINASVDKKLITEVAVRKDSNGKEMPVLIVDPKVSNDVVIEKYGSNPAYVYKIINISLKAMVVGLSTEAMISLHNTGSYTQFCDIAQKYLLSEIDKKINSEKEIEDDLNSRLGVNTALINNVSKLTCKSNSDVFIITIPITLENGTKTNLCTTNSTQVYGDGDFANMLCVKKY